MYVCIYLCKLMAKAPLFIDLVIKLFHCMRNKCEFVWVNVCVCVCTLLLLLQQVFVSGSHGPFASSLLSRACKFCVVERVIVVCVEFSLITHVQMSQARCHHLRRRRKSLRRFKGCIKVICIYCNCDANSIFNFFLHALAPVYSLFLSPSHSLSISNVR